MQIISIEAPGKAVLRTGMPDEKLGSHEVRVHIKRVSLCGSDYKLFDGKYNAPGTYPVIPGHEWSGEVVETGTDVIKVEAGDHVTGDCSRYCGKCSNCMSDRNLCQSIEKFGLTIDGFLRSEAVVNEKYIYKTGRQLSFKAAALAEPVAVAYHALSGLSIDDIPGKVLVIGCGAIGIAAYLLLKYELKVKDLYINDLNDKRINCLDRITGEKSQRYFYSTKGIINSYGGMYAEGGFNLVCEMSGSPEAFNTALEVSSPCGTIVTTGLYGEASINIGLITMKRLTVKGSIGGTGEFEKSLQFCQKYQNIIKQLVTSEYNYKNYRDAFIQSHMDSSNIKTQIVF